MVPYNLIQTSADITAAYGKTSVSSIPHFQYDFSKYGFSDLTPETIAKTLISMKIGSFTNVEFYLSDKLGYPHSIAHLYDEGLKAAHSFSLINKKRTNA